MFFRIDETVLTAGKYRFGQESGGQGVISPGEAGLIIEEPFGGLDTFADRF